MDLEEYEANLKKLQNCTGEKTHYYGTKTDARLLGNDHDEVATVVEIICCKICCQAYHRYQRDMDRSMRQWTGKTCHYPTYGTIKDISGTIVRDKNGDPTKIIHLRGRSLKESLDSDEMRNNHEWLD